MDPTDQSPPWGVFQGVDPSSDFVVYPADTSNPPGYPNSQSVGNATNGMTHALINGFVTLNSAPPVLESFESYFGLTPPPGNWDSLDSEHPSTSTWANVQGPYSATVIEPSPSALSSALDSEPLHPPLPPHPHPELALHPQHAPEDLDNLAVQSFDLIGLST